MQENLQNDNFNLEYVDNQIIRFMINKCVNK